jgi:hypothetical protein
VALRTRDYMLRRLEYLEILIRLEEIEANSLKTVSLKTEDTGSSA